MFIISRSVNVFWKDLPRLFDRKGTSMAGSGLKCGELRNLDVVGVLMVSSASEKARLFAGDCCGYNNDGRGGRAVEGGGLEKLKSPFAI